MALLVPEISGFSEIIARYDAVISDVWGVLHNGEVATPGAQEALAETRRQGRPVILLTNAPRPPDSIRAQLHGFGIGDAAFDAIVSSGGVTRDLLREEGDAPFFHLGPARDIALYEGLRVRPAPFDDASFILCTGPFNDETDAPEDYLPMLERALARELRLFCANPDLVVERGTRILPCAGGIADLYERIGGEVIWVGKPRPLVYEVARDHIARLRGTAVDPARILCIGDAFRTDIAGANAGGHDCVMTLAGIHAHQIGLHGRTYDRARLAALAEETGQRPTMCMVSLSW